MSFYLSGWKLILAVYHIVVDPKTNVSKFNRYQAECVIPWANDVLLLLTVALQAAQQMKDKVISLVCGNYNSMMLRYKLLKNFMDWRFSDIALCCSLLLT